MNNNVFRSFEVPSNDTMVTGNSDIEITAKFPISHKVNYPTEFILGGNATFTIRSKKTGKHFTYKITQKVDPVSQEQKDLFFVGVLTGTDNTSSYTYLGTINHGTYRHGIKSSIGPGTPCAQAFKWFMENISSPNVDVFHAGRCGKCGKKLTTPDSIEKGFGPECCKK